MHHLKNFMGVKALPEIQTKWDHGRWQHSRALQWMQFMAEMMELSAHTYGNFSQSPGWHTANLHLPYWPILTVLARVAVEFYGQQLHLCLWQHTGLSSCLNNQIAKLHQMPAILLSKVTAHSTAQCTVSPFHTTLILNKPLTLKQVILRKPEVSLGRMASWLEHTLMLPWATLHEKSMSPDVNSMQTATKNSDHKNTYVSH